MRNFNLRLDVDESGLEGTEEELRDMRQRARNLKPVFEKAGLALRKYTKSNYLSNGLEVGGWSPLSPKYAAWKATRFPGAPPMVRTGRLFNSVAVVGPEIDAHDTWATYSVEGVEYAKFHQYGTTKMPKRQILFAPELWTKEIAEMAADFVANGTIGGRAS